MIGRRVARALLVCCAALWILASLVCTQSIPSSQSAAASQASALQRFGETFQQAVLQARAGRSSDFAAANRLLERALALVPELPKAQRAQAEFGIAIRKAQLYQRSGNAERAALVASDAQARWGGDPTVWQGSHRAIGLVILWACLPLEQFLERATPDDRAFLLAQATDRYQHELVGALALTRADLLLLSATSEARGVALLQKTWEELRALAAGPSATGPNATGPSATGPSATGTTSEGLTAWRVLCAQRLFAYHFERRDYERARPWLDEVPQESAHAPRSKLALELGDYPTAEAEARQAAARDPLWWAQVGDTLEVQGRFEAALVAYETCLATGKHPLDLAAAWNGKGDALRGARKRDGSYDFAAASAYESGRALLAGIPGPRAKSELAECAKDLGRLAEAAGTVAKARACYAEALAGIAAARAELPMDVLGDAFLGDAALLAVDGLLRTAAPGASSAWESLATIEAMRARGLLDWMSAPPRSEAWQELRMRVAAVLLAGDSGAIGDRLRALERERMRLGLGARPSAPVLAPQVLQGLVDSEPETVFVVTWLDHERGVASTENRARLLLFGRQRAQVFDLGTRGRAERLSRSAIAAVAGPDSEPWPALTAAAEFWMPAEVRAALLAARRVVLCLDPAAARLPFEALPCEGTPLGLRVAVERAPSLSVWRQLRGRSAHGDLRVVVDSIEDGGASAALGLPPLRFSGREGNLVVASLGVTTHVVGPAATLPAIRTALHGGGVDVLHLSAHAIAHPSLPTASALLLSDGPVPFTAMSDLPLSGALVVLSACSTAGTTERGGEGVVGLLWGPLAAGARAVVASIYEVNQQATSDLMTTFHAERSAGRQDAEALRLARVRLAASANYAHPHYWAGFAIFASGDTSVPVTSWREVPLWGAALCFLGACALFVKTRRSLPGQ